MYTYEVFIFDPFEVNTFSTLCAVRVPTAFGFDTVEAVEEHAKEYCKRMKYHFFCLGDLALQVAK